MLLGEDGAPRVTIQLLDRVAHSLPLDISDGGRLSLSESLLVDLGVLRGETPRLRILDAAGRAMTQCRLPSLSLAGTHYADLVCTVVDEARQERIGLELLRDFRLTLNYEFGLAGLEHVSKSNAQDPPLSGYGILLDTRREGRWSIRVAEASPAHRAGMRSGDVLIALGGQRVAGAGYDAIAAQLLAAPETLLRVTFTRGAVQPRSVTLKAEVLL
jgi:hypothetical protein